MTATKPAPDVNGGTDSPDSGTVAGSTMWTSRLRRAWMSKLPPDKLLPDRQPAYVASWIYVFGVLTLAAFLVIIVSGLALAFAGPAWYHTSSLGHFTNSLHFWSVQLFFVFMVIHLWGKFWMAAWRGRRVMTWITGVVAFLASIGTAFTGYLVQTNFDSQWISFEAKDGLNAVGIGAFFNVANLGQMLLLHACLLPLVVGVIVVWHVLLVRRRGVVPPIDAVDRIDPADAPREPVIPAAPSPEEARP
jgi:quinol-cytochrome oxidoreductase complex cytochrome b subunit